MAALYQACDCVVQPYRGEGFCLPVAEHAASLRASGGGPRPRRESTRIRAGTPDLGACGGCRGTPPRALRDRSFTTPLLAASINGKIRTSLMLIVKNERRTWPRAWRPSPGFSMTSL